MSSPSSPNPLLKHTYAEVRGEEPFNWFEWLQRAINGNVDVVEWRNAERRASSWTTCACGNLCSILPRNERGEPMDPILAVLGGVSGFYGAITSRDPEQAAVWLGFIEQRSAHLIEKELAKRAAFGNDLI